VLHSKQEAAAALKRVWRRWGFDAFPRCSQGTGSAKGDVKTGG